MFLTRFYQKFIRYIKFKKVCLRSIVLIIHRMSNVKIFTLISILTLLQLGNALKVDVFPDSDTFIDSMNPNTNYGSPSVGVVFQDIYGDQAFLDLLTKVTITNMPQNITDARFVYTQVGINVDELIDGLDFPFLKFDVYETTTNWTSSTVTWNTAPPTLRLVVTDYQDYDILRMIIPATDIYRTAKAEGRNVISIRTHSEYSATFIYMRNAGILFRPHFIVTY
jgi:hypothetical protein